MGKLKHVFIACLAITIASTAHSQRTNIYVEPEVIYRDGLDLFQKEKYAAAQPKFQEFLALNKPLALGTKASAAYLDAVCAVELFHDDAEVKLNNFLKNYPESPLTIKAKFQLGKLKFRQKKYKDAIREFLDTDADQLSREEWYEFKYKLGYSYFATGQFKQAQPLFREIKDSKNVYAVPATYYYAHIAYLDKKYDEALVNFRKIENEKAFANMVPYYVVQIYYFQKKYDDVISYGKALTDTAKGKSISPVYRLLAESYYIKNNDAKAIEFYEKYAETGQSLERDGTYKFGRAYYNTGNYEKAIEKLASVTGDEDALAQNAWYTLADCYMKTKQEKKALDAFKMAYKTDFDKKVTEDALFNFAKLSFKIDFDPYNEAIKALREYLEAYPNSSRAKEAYGFLAEVYMTTRNYKDALQSLEKIRKSDSRLEDAYRRVAYFHGQDLFNARQYDEALKMFNISAKPGWNNSLAAASIYWQGEIFYRQNQLAEASEAYNEFLVTPGAMESGFLNDAYYNLGYIQYKKQNYNKAVLEFRKYIDNYKKGGDSKRRADACLRAGDCYYVARDWNQALAYYNKAIETSSQDADYGLLQKAIIQGVQKQTNDKLATLRKIKQQYPSSPYMAEALYELGSTLINEGQPSEGEAELESLIKNYPNSAFHKKALNKIGLYNMNNRKDEVALSYFKQTIEKYPGTREATEALSYVRTIYVNNGKADEVVDFYRSIKGAELSEATLDSTYYSSAENLVLKNDCENAITAFSKYLDKFPNGSFIINSHHYRGECYLQKENADEAIKDFEYVAQAGASNFQENALERLGDMYYQRKLYEKTMAVYEQIEKLTEMKDNKDLAQRRLLESYSVTQNNDKVIEYADYVLKNDKTSSTDKEIIYLMLGKAYIAKQQVDLGLTWLKKASDSKKTVASAEATYIECKIMFDKGQYTQCQKRILATVNDMVSYYDWLSKNFILLGDVYMKLDNYDQAIATLQSVIDNNDNPEILAEANQKMQDAKAEQQRRTAKPEQNEVEFDAP